MTDISIDHVFFMFFLLLSLPRKSIIPVKRFHKQSLVYIGENLLCKLLSNNSFHSIETQYLDPFYLRGRSHYFCMAQREEKKGE